MSLSDCYPIQPVTIVTVTAATPIRPTDLRRYVDEYLEQVGNAHTRRNALHALIPWVEIWGDRAWSGRNWIAVWDEYKAKYDRSPATWKLTRSHLHGFEQWLGVMGYCNTRFASLLKTERVDTTVRHLITYQEYLALIAYTPRFRTNLDMVYLYKALWMTGMALVDACNLQWSDVDIDRGIIHVRRRKTGVESIIPLAADHHFLAVLRNRYPDRMKGVGTWPSVNGNHYIENNLANKIVADSPQIHFRHRAWCKGAGVPEFKLHDFRATFITHALASSADPANLSLITGHSEMESLKSYALPQQEVLRNISEAATARAQQQ